MHKLGPAPRILTLFLGLMISHCSTRTPTEVVVSMPTFSQDVAFMQEHTEILILSDAEGEAQVAVAPGYQGRVMTSTALGPGGPSYGWIGREAIQDGTRQAHINVFGGEDRFWLGPEGGQYSIFFPSGKPFELEHWQTPEPIDWGAWEVVSRSSSEARFRREMVLQNYSETEFHLTAERRVRLFSRAELDATLGTSIDPGLKVVAFQSDNRIVNTGSEPWSKNRGLLSIWILGMFHPSEQTTVVIPFQPGPESELGPIVNDTYFGKVPADRLKVVDGYVFFRGDGKHRSKIGIGPLRSRPILGSYDSTSHLLTLVQYSYGGSSRSYVNSMWEIQENPYSGDVVNSYNDGPPSPGAEPLGPFYELETSSPAVPLQPGQSLTHVHSTIHLQGDPALLDGVARAVLGLDLATIRDAFD